MPSPAPWHAEEIKARLRMRGTSLSEIANELGISAPVVSVTIRYSNRRSRRVENAVAKAIGVEPSEIWPDRYSRKATRRNVAA